MLTSEGPRGVKAIVCRKLLQGLCLAWPCCSAHSHTAEKDSFSKYSRFSPCAALTGMSAPCSLSLPIVTYLFLVVCLPCVLLSSSHPTSILCLLFSICLSIHPFTHTSSIYPPTRPSTHIFIHPPAHPPTHLCVHLSIYLLIYLSIHHTAIY